MKPAISNYTRWPRNDGDVEEIERSCMRDFQTLPHRWAGLAIEVMGVDAADDLLMPGVNAYNTTEYEEALGWFVRCVNAFPDLEAGLLYTPLRFCRNVHSTESDECDLAYLASRRGGRLARWRRRNEAEKAQCKWCGHYTTYLDPDRGDGWAGENTCERCGWNFPMPDFAWDCPEGLAYSFYRGSFSGNGFYDWFESRFAVSPGRQHYMSKS